MGIGSPMGNLPKTYFEFGALTTVDINSEKVFRDMSFAWSKRLALAGLGSADDDGSEWVGANRDNRSSTTPDTVVKLNPTINDVGILLPSELMIPSNGTAAVASFGGQSKDDQIIIGRTDVKYMFRLSNQENTVANCTFAMTVFEALEA